MNTIMNLHVSEKAEFLDHCANIIFYRRNPDAVITYRRRTKLLELFKYVSVLN